MRQSFFYIERSKKLPSIFTKQLKTSNLETLKLEYGKNRQSLTETLIIRVKRLPLWVFKKMFVVNKGYTLYSEI